MKDTNIMTDALLFKDESYRIQGAVFEVYREKGGGFAEGVYQECLEIEFDLQGIPFVAQPELKLTYKGRSLRSPRCLPSSLDGVTWALSPLPPCNRIGG